MENNYKYVIDIKEFNRMLDEALEANEQQMINEAINWRGAIDRARHGAKDLWGKMTGTGGFGSPRVPDNFDEPDKSKVLSFGGDIKKPQEKGSSFDATKSDEDGFEVRNTEKESENQKIANSLGEPEGKTGPAATSEDLKILSSELKDIIGRIASLQEKGILKSPKQLEALSQLIPAARTMQGTLDTVRGQINAAIARKRNKEELPGKLAARQEELKARDERIAQAAELARQEGERRKERENALASGGGAADDYGDLDLFGGEAREDIPERKPEVRQDKPAENPVPKKKSAPRTDNVNRRYTGGNRGHFGGHISHKGAQEESKKSNKPTLNEAIDRAIRNAMLRQLH